jgi:hypothetical protein
MQHEHRLQRVGDDVPCHMHERRQLRRRLLLRPQRNLPAAEDGQLGVGMQRYDRLLRWRAVPRVRERELR